MRPIHLLLGLVVILGSGAAAFVATGLAARSEPPQPEVFATENSAPADESVAIRTRSNEDKLAMLLARLDDMAIELENLRNSARREPAAVAVMPVELAPSAANLHVSEEQRQVVLAVLAEDRARIAAEAEAKRIQGEKEAAQRRAARVAKDLSLSPGDESRLADLMFESGKKRQEMFDGARNGNVDRESMRTQFDAFRTWQTDQLTVAFGASIADQILQTEGDRMGFGGGPGGQAGQTGQGGGRGQRRNAAGGAGGQGGAGGGQQQN